MTSFFDDLHYAIQKASNPEEVGDIERNALKIISLATGDREFPQEWRDRVWMSIAGARRLRQERQGSGFDQMETSVMFGDLHNIFHALANARIETRFGVLMDNPAAIVEIRDGHDSTG